MGRTVHTCSVCEKSDAGLHQPFESCSLCNSQTYCSQECFKSDWQSHRKTCGASILDRMSEPQRNFYQTLVPDDFLHACPEKDVYDMLDDCFFLRIADHYCFTDVGRARGGNMGKFQDFLDLAEERAGLLPPWWSARKRRDCEKTARETERMAPGSEDYDTKDFIVDHALIHAYMDYNIPMKLRLLAEKIYGSRATPEWWGEAGALKSGP